MWPEKPESVAEIFRCWRELRQFFLVHLAVLGAVLLAHAHLSARAVYAIAWVVVVAFVAYYLGPVVESGAFVVGLWHRAIHNGLYALGMAMASVIVVALSVALLVG